jgi:hypothetical protein
LQTINPLWLVLATGAITILSSISSLWLGSRLTRGAEDRKWRRDHALEAYSEFIRLVNAITVEAGNTYVAECGTEEHVKHKRLVFEKLSELFRTNDRVILLASDDLQAPLSALTKHVTGEFITKSTQCPRFPDAEVRAEGIKLAELNADFIFRARNDLGVHPALERRQWKLGR